MGHGEGLNRWIYICKCDSFATDDGENHEYRAGSTDIFEIFSVALLIIDGFPTISLASAGYWTDCPT
jgi:hypothetical protein